MNQLLRAAAALLIGLAALILAMVSSPQDQKVDFDQGQKQVTPAPPTPPAPPDESNAGAIDRAKKSGRPLVLYFTADWCEACRYVNKCYLSDLRKQGELGIIDIEKERSLYDYYTPSGLIPAVLVYQPQGDDWKLLGKYVGSDVIGRWLRPGEQAGNKEQPAEKRVGLLVVYDGGWPSMMMFSTLEKLREAGWNIAYADYNDPANKRHLEQFEIDPAELPHYTMYVGHEATEVLSGVVDESTLVEWFERTAKGERTPQAKPSTSQARLRSEDRKFLRQELTPGSCGMLGCQMHGGGVRLVEVPIPVEQQAEATPPAPNPDIDPDGYQRWLRDYGIPQPAKSGCPSCNRGRR